MKYKLILSALFSLNVLAFSVASATCTQANVIAVEKARLAALNAHDVSALLKFYPDDSISLYAYSSELFTNNAAREAYFKNLFAEDPNFKTTQSQVVVKKLNGGDFLTTGTYTSTSTKNGEQKTATHQATFIYKNSAQGCELVLQQVTRLPK